MYGTSILVSLLANRRQQHVTVVVMPTHILQQSYAVDRFPGLTLEHLELSRRYRLLLLKITSE